MTYRIFSAPSWHTVKEKIQRERMVLVTQQTKHSLHFYPEFTPGNEILTNLWNCNNIFAKKLRESADVSCHGAERSGESR